MSAIVIVMLAGVVLIYLMVGAALALACGIEALLRGLPIRCGPVLLTVFAWPYLIASAGRGN